MAIVILGGGIIGVSTAFHLQELGCKEDIHIIEATKEPFSGASGYSAGFLASNWYSSSVLPLGKLSFALHKSLAQEHNGSDVWGYSGSTGLSLGPSISSEESDSENGADWLLQGTSRAQVADRNTADASPNTDQNRPSWLRVAPGQECEILSGPSSTAQVSVFGKSSYQVEVLKRGVTASTLFKNQANQVEGVGLDDGTRLICSKIVFTCGPWTPIAFEKLFPRSSNASKRVRDIGRLGGHSIIVKSPHWKAQKRDGRYPEGCHAVFATSFSGSKAVSGSKSFAPEIFSRLPDEIYIAGLNSATAPLPSRADINTVDNAEIERLKEATRKILRWTKEESDGLEITRRGNCYRPTTSSGRPYISKVPSDWLKDDALFSTGSGVWLSAGHGPWGISLSQGTGRLLAEMVMGVPQSIDNTPFEL